MVSFEGKSKGFTLVEVLVGLAIAVVLTASMSSSLLVVKSVTLMARHKMEALQIVRGQIELLKATSFNYLRPRQGYPLDINALNLTDPNNPDVNTNSTPITKTAAYDVGANGVFGANDNTFGFPVPDTDDLKGTLTIAAVDFLDMDNDCGTNPNCRTETAIDVDGDGLNDPTAAIPVRVTFTWKEHLVGQSHDCTVFANTLIAS